MRDGVPGGNSRSMTGLATYWGSPSVGWVCIRKPGAALTSTMPPPVSRTGTSMSGQMKSMPAMSRPTTRAAVSAISTLSGWASSVRSMDVPPVDMLPVSASLTKAPSGGTSSGVRPWAREDRLGVRIEPDAGEDLLVADAPARVGVGDVHELADRVLAVAGDAGRHAFGDRRELAADHEAAVVAAGDVRLHDHVAAAALAQRLGPGGADGGLVPQVQRDAPAVVAVEGLDDARVAQAAGRGDGLVLGLHHLRARHREARGVEEAVGQLLVRRDVDGDAARAAGHRGADPLLVDALAELDEGVAVEAHVRDVAAGGLVDERLRGGSEGEPLRHAGSGSRAPP